MQVVNVLLHIACLRLLPCVQVIALRMKAIEGKCGMMPVKQRVIKTDLETLGAKCLHPGTNEISARRSICCFILRELGVPQTKAVVVLGGDDGVAHPCLPSHTRPCQRVVEIRLKVLKITL